MSRLRRETIDHTMVEIEEVLLRIPTDISSQLSFVQRVDLATRVLEIAATKENTDAIEALQGS
jgi:hypothetical protein